MVAALMWLTGLILFIIYVFIIGFIGASLDCARIKRNWKNPPPPKPRRRKGHH